MSKTKEGATAERFFGIGQKKGLTMVMVDPAGRMRKVAVPGTKENWLSKSYIESVQKHLRQCADNLPVFLQEHIGEIAGKVERKEAKTRESLQEAINSNPELAKELIKKVA